MSPPTATVVENEDTDDVAREPRPAASRARLAGLDAPLAMIGTVLVGLVLPVIRNPIFYYWDDTAGASLPAWRVTGQALLDGRLPLLNLELWRGGDFAAEAAFGMYNPLLLILYLLTGPFDDLALVAMIIKVPFFLLMAVGAYLLCRDYGSTKWPAAVIGAALPLSGFTLWMDGAAWVTALVVTALTPWVWLTARRALYGRGSLVWVVVAGYLCASAGNPYGLVSAGLAMAAVGVEALAMRRARRIIGLAVAGVSFLLLSVATYLPFVLSASVSYRADSRTLNNEVLSPGLSDLLGMSTPSFTPYVTGFGTPFLTFPALYLAWFVLPLLPWLRWSTLRAAGRRLTAIYAFGGIYLMLVLGPSQIWFFRWPIRLLPYLYLALGVLFALLLSRGLDRSHVRVRASLSVAIVLFGGWLAWSDYPDHRNWHIAGSLLVIALLAAYLRIGRTGSRAGGLALLLGSLVVLTLQLDRMPGNNSVLNYNFPRSEAVLQDRFEDRYQGMTVQIADGQTLESDRRPDGAYQDLLFGSMYAVAGVESLTAYSGVGFTAIDRELCIRYEGSTCPEAWEALWREPPGAREILADLLRVETVVVQNGFVDDRTDPPPGWQQDERTEYVTVFTREDPLRWPDGRLSAVDGEIRVEQDSMVGQVGERVSFDSAQAGDELIFARLAWPGYSAAIDGTAVDVEEGPAGLVTVVIPEGISSGVLTLDWSPPGRTLSVVSATTGAVLAIAILGYELVVRRRRGSQGSSYGDADAAERALRAAP
ncbi:MAG: hypothetical protein M3400_14585 [Actinomycetota bacterium]|nr:hypothetical protein [Actinomycetota bacterium]